jgi:hypothetical protein
MLIRPPPIDCKNSSSLASRTFNSDFQVFNVFSLSRKSIVSFYKSTATALETILCILCHVKRRCCGCDALCRRRRPVAGAPLLCAASRPSLAATAASLRRGCSVGLFGGDFQSHQGVSGDSGRGRSRCDHRPHKGKTVAIGLGSNVAA